MHHIIYKRLLLLNRNHNATMKKENLVEEMFQYFWTQLSVAIYHTYIKQHLLGFFRNLPRFKTICGSTVTFYADVKTSKNMYFITIVPFEANSYYIYKNRVWPRTPQNLVLLTGNAYDVVDLQENHVLFFIVDVSLPVKEEAECQHDQFMSDSDDSNDDDDSDAG